MKKAIVGFLVVSFCLSALQYFQPAQSQALAAVRMAVKYPSTGDAKCHHVEATDQHPEYDLCP